MGTKSEMQTSCLNFNEPRNIENTASALSVSQFMLSNNNNNNMHSKQSLLENQFDEEINIRYSCKLGLFDGNGLTNGNGLTIVKSSIKSREDSKLYHKQNKIKNFRWKRLRNRLFGIILTIILFILPLNVYFWDIQNTSSDDKIIDGQFNDWKRDTMFIDNYFETYDNVNVDIVRYDVAYDEESYFFYLEVYGTIFNGNIKQVEEHKLSVSDTVHIFIDSDNNKKTGYSIMNIGAEYRLEIQGFNNVICKSSFNHFNPTFNSYDWNGWAETTAYFVTGIRDKRLEAKIPVNSITSGSGDINILYQTQDSLGNFDFSDKIITPNKKLIYVTQIKNDNLIFFKNNRSEILTSIEFQSVNSEAKLNGFVMSNKFLLKEYEINRIYLTNKTEELSEGQLKNDRVHFQFNEPFRLNSDERFNFDVHLELSDQAKNSSVLSLVLESIDCTGIENSLPEIITPCNDIKYIEKPSSDIIIDGAFGDWLSVPINVDFDDTQQKNSNINIESYRVTQNDGLISFCFSVEGKILEGTYSPIESEYMLIKNPSEPIDDKYMPINDELKKFTEEILDKTQQKSELKGIDTAHIFIDRDMNPFSGYSVPTLGLGAEYLVEITGKNGEVLSSNYYQYTGASKSDWSWKLLGHLPVGLDEKNLETQIELKKLGLATENEFKIYFHITDWNKDQNEYPGDLTEEGYRNIPSITEDIIYNNSKSFEICDISILNDFRTSNSRGKMTRGGTLTELVNGTGENSNDCFGWNVSYVGDLNEDGFSDILVGAPFNDTGNSNAGAAFLFFGYKSIDLRNLNPKNANVSIYGNTSNGHFGWSVADAGDLDNDGLGEIIIGSPGVNGGCAYIFSYKDIKNAIDSDGQIYISTERNITITGSDVNDLFGMSLVCAGDVNKDGFDDILIGAPGNFSNTGAAFIFFGNESINRNLLSTDANCTMYGESIGDRFGAAVSCAGDINNDSYSDVIVGAPGYCSNLGRAYIYYGSEDMNGWGLNIEFARWAEEDGAVMTPPGYVIYKGQWLAQSFTPDKNYQITKVSLLTSINGAPGNLVISLQGNNSGPDGNIFAYTSSINTGPTTLTWMEFEFLKPYTLTAGVKYWLVAAGDGKNALNSWEWLEDESSSTDFLGGNGAFSSGSGKPWIQDPTAHDYLFKVYGQLLQGLEPDVRCTGSQKGDAFGWAVSSAGDVNADGFEDILIGAPGTENGSAYIIYGGSQIYDFNVSGSGWSDEILLTNWESGGNLELVIYNNSLGNSQTLSQSFIPDRDINLTKISLFIEAIGTPGTLIVKLMGSKGTKPNTVPDNIVLAQSPSISTGKRSYTWMTFTLNSPYLVKANCEYFIVAEGNGSSTSNCWVWYTQSTGGYNDGNYAYNQGGSWISSTRDCYFRAYGKPETVLPNLTYSGKPGDNFGWSVTDAGDLNFDGFDDIIIGAPNNGSVSGSIQKTGAIFVFYGNSTLRNRTSIDADNVSFGECANDCFGWSIDYIEDINGDGYLDIIVGAPFNNNNTFTDSGKIYVVSDGMDPIIPEFSNILLPILIILILLIIAHRPKRQKLILRGVI